MSLVCSCLGTKRTPKFSTDSIHPGWTPVRNIGHGNTKLKGDGRVVIDTTTSSGACVTRTRRYEFRIGQLGRIIAAFATGGDVPWAWNEIAYTVCCDGTSRIRFAGSEFPSHRAYVDNSTVGTHHQANLETFMFLSPLAPTPGREFAEKSQQGRIRILR